MSRKYYKYFLSMWHKKYSRQLKKRRLTLLDNLTGGKLFDEKWLDGKKILEVGCNSGKDFIKHFENVKNVEITGIDHEHYDFTQENVRFMQLDAEKLPFEDNEFDLCVSFGVLEHIQPIEKLCNVIQELDRVSKSYLVVLPNISTLLEPHTASFFWQLRANGKKRNYGHLNYFSDEAWLQFQGFSGAKLKRFGYIPGLIRNIVIYKV